MAGVFTNPMVEQTELLKEIRQDVKDIKNILVEQTQMMEDLQKSMYDNQLSSFDSDLINLNKYCDYIEEFFQNALDDFPDLKQPEVLPDGASEEEQEADAQKWQQYNSDLLTAITTAGSDPADHNYFDYYTYTSKFAELERLYAAVTGAVTNRNSGQESYQCV